MARDTKRTTTGDKGPPLQISLPYREHDAFARAYAVQAACVASATTSISTVSRSKVPSTGFSDLPRELRDKIYELAVIDKDKNRAQCVETASTHGIYSNATVNQVSSMGEVSKQVRREAFEMYFKYNRFVIDRIQVYNNGNWLGWPTEKKMADLLKRLIDFEIPFEGLPSVYIEQQNDGTWSGEWDETDWSFLCPEDEDEISDRIIENVCEATERCLDMLLVAFKEDRQHITDAVKQFKNDILLVYAEAKQQATDEQLGT